MKAFLSGGDFFAAIKNKNSGFYHRPCPNPYEATKAVVKRIANKLVGIIAITAVCFFAVLAQASEDYNKKIYRIDIAATNAADALNKLASQTGVVMLFPYQQAKAKQANPVNGQYTLKQALTILLKHSGLVSGLTQEGVIRISTAEDWHQKNSEGINMKAKKQLLASTIAFFLGSGGQVVYGQESEPESKGYMLEEIIVTAQKRSEDLQKIPISMAVMTGEYIENNNLTDLVSLKFYVPGLDIKETSPNGSSFSLRGIPNGGSFLGLPSVMDVYLDGAPLSGRFSLSTMFDVDRIEVLRGPQGALQGRPAPAGAMLLHSRRPSVSQGNEYEGRVRTRIRDDGGYEFEGGVSTVLIPDELAVRIAGQMRNDDGRADYVNNSGQGPERDNEAIRLSFVWEPSDNFSALLTNTINDREETGVVSYFRGNGELGYVDAYTNSRTLVEYEETGRKYNLHNLNMEWNFAGHSLTSVTSYLEGDAYWYVDLDRATTDVRVYTLDTEERRFVQEVRLASEEEGVWEYMVGLYYFEDSFAQWWNFPEEGRGGLVSSSRDQEQSAVFTFHKFHLTDQLTLQAGLRWQEYSTFKVARDVTDEDDALTWSGQLSYEVSDDILGFVSYQRGFRPGGSVPQPATVQLVPSEFFEYPGEESDSFDLGVKTTLLDGRLILNATLYWQDFENFPNGARGIPTDQNLDGIYNPDPSDFTADWPRANYATSLDAIARGVEIEWQALLSDNWTFSGSLARNEMKYGDDASVPCAIFDDGGTPVFPPGEYFSTCDVSNEDLDEVRKWTASMTSEYVSPDLFDWADWYIRGTYNFLGERKTTLNTTINDLGGVSLLNLYTGFRSKDDSWDVGFWVENVGDKQAYTDILDGGNLDTTYAYANGFIEERRYGITASYKF